MSNICSSRFCNVCQSISSNCSSKQNNEQFVILKQQKCGGCQLVHYCGVEHQRLDWPLHKNLCRAVQRILKTYNVNHPLALEGKLPQNRQEMTQAIQMLKMLLPIALKRKLFSYEHELTSFPGYCDVCYSIKRTLYTCSICRGVSYCSMEHAKEDAINHSQICNKLQLYYCQHKAVPMRDESIPFQSFLRPCSEQSLRNFDLIEAIEYSTKVTMPEVPTLSLKDYQHFSFVADFSAVATICFALTQLKTQVHDDDQMMIFIIGATDEQLYYFRGLHTRFFFLHNPKIRTLTLCYIGPEVIHESGLNSQSYKFLGAMRTVKHLTYRGMFQDYMKGREITPTMIIAFNCGFSEFPICTDLNDSSKTQSSISDKSSKSPWYDGLYRLAQTHLIPIFFTSYTHQEAEADYVEFMKVVKEIDDKFCIDVCRFLNLIPNPYRDIRPFLNWETTDKERIFYRNGYIQGVITEIKERERFI